MNTNNQKEQNELNTKNLELGANEEIRDYETPVLICYGDVRDVTLGPTIGEGESGCDALFRPGPGGCP